MLASFAAPHQAQAATLIIQPQTTLSATMSRFTTRDGGYAQFLTVSSPPATDPLFGYDMFMDDGSSFTVSNLTFTATRTGFAPVTSNYTAATFSDPATPLYRAWNGTTDVSVNGAQLNTVSMKKFAVSGLPPTPNGLDTVGDVDQVTWTSTVFQNGNANTPFTASGTTSVTYTATPEPNTFGLLGMSMVGFVGLFRRRQ